MILDSDVLIDLMLDHKKAHEWFDSLSEWPPISVITAGEMLFGCTSQEKLRKTRKFLEPFSILYPPTENLRFALETYPELRLTYGVGFMDSMIAVTAIHYGLPLVTFNVKHFRHIPGLTTLQPYEH